jgi:hypothetical protein
MGASSTNQTTTMPKVLVVVPTVSGRELEFERCVDAYRFLAGRKVQSIETFSRTNEPTCGDVWRQGLEYALRADRFTHIHYTADDLVPHSGWLVDALQATDAGYIPAALIWSPTGDLEACGGDLKLEGHVQTRVQADWQYADYTGVPFMPIDLARKVGMPSLHYYSDVWVSYAAREFGVQTVVRHGYEFTHSRAMPARGAGMSQDERNMADSFLFRQAFRNTFNHNPQPAKEGLAR